MNFKKTLLLLLGTILFGSGIYYFEVIRKEQKQIQKQSSDTVFHLKSDEINFFQIQTKNQLLTMQKNESKWQITEPIQDQADQNVISEMIKKISEQKMQNIESTSAVSLSEFGLDEPLATIILKNSLGKSEKLKIGQQKNFEGQPFAQINDDTQIRIVDSFWLTNTEKNSTYFREKRLYLEQLADINKVRIKSMNDDFILEKKDQSWIFLKNPDLVLDQNKVRKMIKEFAETTIQDYVFEADPSEKEKKDKGLHKAPVQIEFETLNSKWSVSVNMNDKDKALYALTTKPTFFVKLDMSKWQNFANATLDSLRDRKTLMNFSITDVQKIYSKLKSKLLNQDYEFVNEKQTWILKSKLPEQSDFLPVEVEKILNQIHDLEISEFIESDISKKFEGQNMIILKSTSDQLVFQLNWGPLVKIKTQGLEKEVYLARTQISKNIFAIDKNKIDELNFDRVFKKTETLSKDLKK